MTAGVGVQVHITGTTPDLRDHLERIAKAIRGHGDDVTMGGGTAARRRAEIDKVRQADTLVFLLGGRSGLREDGTAPCEWELDAAIDLGIPVAAYETSTASDPPAAPGRAGYSSARHELFRRMLMRTSRIGTFHDADELLSGLQRDLERTRARLRAVAPEVIRSIHRRLRSHPDAVFDAFAVSMHNMDTLYWAHKIAANSETPARLLGRKPGGAGANTMVALSRLGLSTGVAGAVGDDNAGRALRADLVDNEVDTTLLLTVAGKQTGQNLLVRDRYHNYLNLVHGEANDHFAEALDQQDLQNAAATAIQRSRLVHLSSFSGVAERTYQERLIRRLSDETVMTFKPGGVHAEFGADRLEAVLGRCDVLLVAENELGLLLARSRSHHDDMPLAARIDALLAWRARRGYATPMIVVVYRGMRDMDKQDLVTVAWGGDGYEGAVGNDGTHRQLQSFTFEDTTGARDATAAGVLFGLLRGRRPADCANLAYVLARSVASDYGCRAGLPGRGLIREHWRQFMQVHEPPRWLDPYG